ncbi:MAG: aminoglycoside 6-adenylyltransferase [Spirochaetes bacterium]|nr:aminoglycoside 6-adenylyltransferase [Spirochaetota bacterium]
MRSEQQMYDLILDIAKNDKRVLAVYINGSRANPDVSADKYQDFDIVYVVKETEFFLADKKWISVFGETAIVQEPDSKDFGWGQSADYSQSYCWLMLFKDGNRIDLHIQTEEFMNKTYGSDSLTIPLLDKYNILPVIPASNDSTYRIKKPDIQNYNGCCNEFWWCLNNAAKGIVRDQLPYALRMYNQTSHAELDKMVEWYIGANNDFSVSSGMWGKYFKNYLSSEMYALYLKSCFFCCLNNEPADYTEMAESIWIMLFAACELFSITAQQVAAFMGYAYNLDDEKNMMNYLKTMRADR